jgi:hypothetical protein
LFPVLIALVSKIFAPHLKHEDISGKTNTDQEGLTDRDKNYFSFCLGGNEVFEYKDEIQNI